MVKERNVSGLGDFRREAFRRGQLRTRRRPIGDPGVLRCGVLAATLKEPLVGGDGLGAGSPEQVRTEHPHEDLVVALHHGPRHRSRLRVAVGQGRVLLQQSFGQPLCPFVVLRPKDPVGNAQRPGPSEGQDPGHDEPAALQLAQRCRPCRGLGLIVKVVDHVVQCQCGSPKLLDPENAMEVVLLPRQIDLPVPRVQVLVGAQVPVKE